VASQSFGSVESYRNSLFILLFDKKESFNPYEKTGLNNYISTKITKDVGNVYTYPIDVSTQSASELAKQLSNRDEKNIYAKALENWFRNSSDAMLANWKKSCGNKCSLEELKRNRPDLLPLRYIVISQGVSGLVAREYIQGIDYIGDYSKVLFFDTPHEGTGFADQALFQNTNGYSLKKTDAKALAAVVPLALSAYVFGGMDALQDVVISITKSAVLGMAQNAVDVSGSFSGANFFNDYSTGSDALWYLAQDASFDDEKYKNLISTSKANVKDNIGGTQWLNATGMQTNYSSPSYGIVYSYGFPTIGNGRRTYDDFIEQSKNHIPKEKFKQVLTDSLKNAMSVVGINDNLTDDISKLADDLLNGKLSEEGRKIVGELVEKYSSLGNVLSDSKLSNYIQGLSELRSLEINMDDLPGTALKILRILDKFIPETYKSELYSAFIESLSPEVAEVMGNAAKCAISGKSSRDCTLVGLSVSAKNLSNFGLNFFDEGIYDVPVYSAYGSNVSAFKNVNVSRIGYDLGDFIENNMPLKDYRDLLSEVGKLEKARYELDMGLRGGCNVLVSPYDEICKAAAFAANVVLIADISGKTSKLTKKMGNLKDNKYLSLGATINHSSNFTYNGLTDVTSFSYPDIEKMLFEAPKISIASVFKKGVETDVEDSIVPLILYGKCKDDIYDISSLEKENNCIIEKNSDKEPDEEQQNILYEASFAEPGALKSNDGERTISVKDLRYNINSNNSMIASALNYWKWSAPTVRKFIYEYRFVIDDLQPDSLRQIKIDFNAGVQMAYEREGSIWNARLRIGGGNWSKPQKVSSPIRADGLFVFHPKDFFDLKLDGEEHLLSSIQKEGPNMVNVYVVNKLGLTDAKEFTYLFEPTPPLLEPGWPRSFTRLSRVDNPYIYYNKQDVVPKFNVVKVALSYFDGGNEVIGETDATYELVDASRGTYKISANMNELWNSQNLKTGNYILEWYVEILDEQNKPTYNKLRVMVYIDRGSPDIDIVLKRKDISGNNATDNWGTVINNGPVSDRAIRALRVFVEDSNGSPFLIKSVIDNNDQYINFGWQKGFPNFEGEAKLFVQAVDYAYSSEEFEGLLSNSNNESEFTLWDEIIKKNGNGDYVYTDGFNITQQEEKIFIDATSPRISDHSVAVDILHSKKEEGYSTFAYLDNEKILGINDTLKITFDVKEPLLGRDSSIISAQIKFDDEKHNIHRVYRQDTTIRASSITWGFIEPEVNRLRDGLYDISVELTDNAGNKSKTIIYKGFVVDRVAPVIVELMNGDVSFSDISELSTSKGYISQISDYDFNKTDLSCYAKVLSGNQNTGWFFVGKDAASKKGSATSLFEFSILDKVDRLPNGLWTISLGCFDKAGNYGELSDFFGMGRRYPRITFPEEGMGDYFSEKVLIEGTTPNPIVKNGNDRDASFTIEWCKLDLSECSSENISYLTKSISEQPKSLAVWNTKGLSGSYIIRLKVDGCDYQGLNCETSSAEKIVSFAEGGEWANSSEEYFEQPTLEVVEFPKGQVPSSEGIIRLKLDGADTSKWSMNVSINVQSPSNPSLFIPAKNLFFNTVRTSPFNGEPSFKNEGLSVWQTGKTWNIYWKGQAESATDGVAPHISLKYQKNYVVFDKMQDLPEEDNSVQIPAINDEKISIPAYDAIRNWNIGEKEIFVQFESDSAFIIDISSVKKLENEKQRIYCGKNSLYAEDVFTASKNSPMLYVFPQQYLSTIVWNGLTQENLYPGGSEVRLYAYAYKKNDKSKLVFCEKNWEQAIKDFEIVKNDQSMTEFYVGISNINEGQNNSFAKSNFNYEFGIAGQPAYVSAKIIGPDGKLVKELMTDNFLLAGTSSSAYSVSWDGMSETGFASTQEGKYKLKITAQRDGKSKSLTHEFELILANKLVPAPREVANDGEYPADLTIDEVDTDEMGNLRYYGNPDYLMEADVSAVTLPLDQQKVSYQWTMNGTQHPIYFEKNRYSVGIHRHRKKFPVTVAILLAGYGHDLTSVYKWNNRSYNYKLIWKRIELEEGKEFDFSKITLDPWNSIVGYDSDGGKLEIGVSVKILPESAANKIAQYFTKTDENDHYELGHFNHDTYSDPNDNISKHNYTWNLIWDSEICKNETSKDKCPQDVVLKYWWNNFDGEKVYWEKTKKQFYYNSGNFTLENKAPSLQCKPSNTIDNSSNNKFICDEKDDYNVHKDMVKISVMPTDAHNDYSYGDYSCWCDNDGSDTEIAIRLKIEVKKDYWWPHYGYSNLANTFTRLDPQNISLFGNEGYCNIKEPCKKFNGDKWNVNNADAELTAFEAQKFSMLKKTENPLLFTDEYSATFNDELSKSTYSMKFYNAKEAPVPFTAAMTWNENGTQKRLNLDSDGNIDSVVTTSIKNPTLLSFYVAPKMTATAALKSDNDIVADYPFTSRDFSQIESGIKEKCKKCVFYSGLGSGLHFGVGDWTVEDWNKVFLTNGVIKNPLTATKDNPETSFSPISQLGSYSSGMNVLNNTYSYDVKEADSYNLVYWNVPEKVFSRTKPEKDKSILENGYAPDGDFKLEIATKGWSPKETVNGWTAVNEGEKINSTASFIWSQQKPWTYNRSSLTHTISLKDVKKQDLDDEILGKPWMKKIEISNPKVYVRGWDGENTGDGFERKLHPYYTAEYDVNAEQFNVTRGKALDYSTRESEKVTLRGRVPESNQKWNLFYVQNGKQFFLKSGTQQEVPVSMPYPVLDYAEMNRIQGNTSFFLTYGGSKGETYFYQLDMHVGQLLKSGEGGVALSMYGEISIDFEPGTWGENDVDVTIRTIPKAGEYNFEAFKNLDIIGPVVEVLPSHDFSNLSESLWPMIHVRLQCDALNGVNPAELKVYKPNFESMKITPLETQNIVAYDKNDRFLDLNDSEFDSKCGSIEIVAKTSTFSTFIVLDSAASKRIELVDSVSTEKHELLCSEMPMDSLWMGTANGWLEFPYPCSGKSNYLIQLRSGESVVAEHQAASTNPIIWPARNSDIGLKTESYSSRINMYGVDGKTSQFRGPAIRIDSVAPTIDEMDISVTENHDSRILQVDVSSIDDLSGISKTRLDVYFGGSLLESRTIWGNEIVAENFVLDRNTLYSCVGCRATVKVTVEDLGHNYAKVSLQSEKLYPYPTSLFLWYPLSEGTGKTAYEVTGNGPDIDISNLKHPWQNGKSLNLFAKDGASGKKNLSISDSLTPFSIELKFFSGNSPGTVFGWLGSNGWTIGVDAVGRYYVETYLGRTTFNVRAERNVKNHIVLTIDGKNVVLYKNGSFVENKILASSLEFGNGGKPQIGRIGSSNSIVGGISDIRIYRSALTASQVSDLYRYGLDLSTGDIIFTRAVSLDRGGLIVDQSCGVAGFAYLRQRNATGMDRLTWNVDVDAGRYNLYLLSLNYASEESRVEIFVNGTSRGIYTVESTGLWKSSRVEGLSLGLSSGMNNISIRPIGSLGIAALALVDETKNIAAELINYGEHEWTNPSPRIIVRMHYENQGDVTWVRPRFQLQNLIGMSFKDVRIRYYYNGEGEAVQAVSFYPNAPMSVIPDAGSTYYGELSLTEPIPAYGSPYYGNGPQIGLHRTDYYFPWNALDDPSFADGATNTYAEAKGIAVLDADGFLLNDWSCYDADGPIEKKRKSVRVLAKDAKAGSNQSSLLTMLAENTGDTPIEGFEVRYYYRDASGKQEVDYYSSPFAATSKISAGGDLYYASFLYTNTILNPGEKTDFGNGVNFEIHNPGWGVGFDAEDDPSHHDLNEVELIEADSAVVLDLNGNLLWGYAPQPRFSSQFKTKDSYEDLIDVDGDIIYVNVTEKGTYTLETVNAIGMPLVSLFNGIWNEGEHSVSISNYTFTPGSYLVLRRGNEILSWKIFR
jgi:hypothetical protein